MKKFALTLVAITALSAPAIAQDDDSSVREGVDLLQQGTRLLLEGLMQELGPALENLEDKLTDLNAYFPPEVLPNGDIIIRRKPSHPIDPPVEGEIDI